MIKDLLREFSNCSSNFKIFNDYYCNIIIIFLILICLICIYFRVSPITIDNSIHSTIQWLYQSTNDICYHCNLSPIYEIKQNQQITFTTKIITQFETKGIINLALYDDEQNRMFDKNTLIYAVLNEIAELLEITVTVLLNKAIELNYYDPTIPLEKSYIALTNI